MNFLTEIAELIKQSKGMEIQLKCIDHEKNQFSLFLMPVVTTTDKQSVDSVAKLTHALNQPIRITGTPTEIDEALSGNLPALTNARITASSNLEEVIQGLTKKTQKKPRANKTTNAPKSNAEKPPATNKDKADSTSKVSKEESSELATAETKTETTQPTQVQMF